MNRMEKFGKVVGVIGGIIVTVGFIYILGTAGASDAEQYTHEYYSFGWLINNLLIGLCICISGLGLIKASEELVILSHKKFRRVWVRNTISNKTISRLVEDGSNIVLSTDEVIHRIGRKVYCFR